MDEYPNNKQNAPSAQDFILWKSIQFPGHEACRMVYRARQWHVDGVAVFSYGEKPCQLSYAIRCGPTWETRSASVKGWVGNKRIQIRLNVDAKRHWSLNEIAIPQVSGCVDLDLNFSPSTNTIAIRRLELAPSEQQEIETAWLRFPSFTLEALKQTYQRMGEDLYLYLSGGGHFAANLKVNQSGLVIDYPGIWQLEGISDGT
jgi:hypothetical protein